MRNLLPYVPGSREEDLIPRIVTLTRQAVSQPRVDSPPRVRSFSWEPILGRPRITSTRSWHGQSLRQLDAGGFEDRSRTSLRLRTYTSSHTVCRGPGLRCRIPFRVLPLDGSHLSYRRGHYHLLVIRVRLGHVRRCLLVSLSSPSYPAGQSPDRAD